MTLRILLIAICAILGLAPSANAALIGIQVQVQLNSGGGFVVVGTAQGGQDGLSTPLIVNAAAGNTLRFIAQYDAVNSYNAYGTTVGTPANPIDDPTEIDFVNGSATDLSGKGFAGIFGNPNNSLNDTTPGTGLANSAGTATVNTQEIFRVDYIVQAGVNSDGLRDFLVNLTSVGTGNTVNSSASEASVRIDGAIVPEPATMLLLGGGLAALAGFARRKR